MYWNENPSFRCWVLCTLLGSLIWGCGKETEPLFKARTAEETGIDFKNTLEYSDALSVLEFEYMYNGAGVAVADFDRDGLQDIYFTANMTSNRLYRNLGNWEFEDLTESAGVSSTGWSNGVAVVDMNQDGFPDIYVSRGGPRGSASKDRANLLFVNQGVKDGKLLFKEEAANWGLADEGYSVQAAFFDYDQDGDLDMYLLSNALVDFNRNTSRPIDRTGKAPSVDKLFKNNGDHTFTDVSSEANIKVEGFGLGVEICDINTDGRPDIYVSNDFLTDDLLYINQGDGTFTNEIGRYFNHLTFNGMGNDIADINNDGLMDVLVLDMLPEDNERWKLTMMGNNYDEFQTGLSYGYQPQYIRNTLQLNNGNGSFSEVGQLSGISATEWSWSALFADFDLDGLKDLCVTNGYRQDITNLDFMVYGNRVLSMGTEEANRKQRLEELNKLPGIKIHNYFFRNKGDLEFEEVSEEVGFTTPTYSNGMAYADFDGDGDLDLVINNIDDPAALYENTSKMKGSGNFLKLKFQGKHPNIEGLGSKVAVYSNGIMQSQYHTPYRGYLSTVETGLHFGLGGSDRVDSLQVIWPDGKRQSIYGIPANSQLLLKYEDAGKQGTDEHETEQTVFRAIDSIGLDFTHREDDFVDFKIQPLLPHMHSRNGPGMAVADVDNNGREDLFIGGAVGQSGSLLLQNAEGTFKNKPFLDPEFEDMGSLFFDADGDGDQDLYVCSGGSSYPLGSESYEDRLYENDGSGNFSRISDLPPNATSTSVVVGADYDKDGRMDLFVGGRVRPGEYPLAPESFLLRNESSSGSISFKEDQDKPAEFESLGMVTAALWTDFNDDSWPDLIVVGEFMSLRFYRNDNGKLEDISAATGLKNTSGWWNSITSGDFDNDGDSDYILGNLGLNSRFKASAEEPLCIYAKDYDKNGQVDPVMCHYIGGENYIAHSRNDLIEQINAMRVRFRTYSDYAKATFEESFLEEELADAVVVKSETFTSSYLENLGEGQFRLSELPRAAQIAPMYGMVTGDYNADNFLDFLAVGNFYSGEVFSGRYDASIGWVMLGDGKGNFESVDVRKSGFFVHGDAKALTALNGVNSILFAVSRNNGEVVTHSLDQGAKNTYHLKPGELTARIALEDGSFRKVECYSGSGYLSQSGRLLILPPGARSIQITNSKGEQLEISVQP